jgi:hypothetical protein
MTRETIIAACQTELATNFDRPAREIVSYWASRIGLSYEEMRALLRERCES